MTRVCLLGDPDSNLQYELLSRETSREALSSYDLERPFENTLAIRTISLGAAVSLLNDLQWYLTRFVEAALVQEPSVDDAEWLSRALAIQLRNGDVDPVETSEFCKVYGIERIEEANALAVNSTDGGGKDAGGATVANSAEGVGEPTRRLVEPLYARRIDGEVPGYDLRDVEETLVVRVTREEFVG